MTPLISAPLAELFKSTQKQPKPPSPLVEPPATEEAPKAKEWEPPEEAFKKQEPWAPPEEALLKPEAKTWSPPEAAFAGVAEKDVDPDSLATRKAAGESLTMDQERILWKKGREKGLGTQTAEFFRALPGAAWDAAVPLVKGAATAVKDLAAVQIPYEGDSPDIAAEKQAKLDKAVRVLRHIPIGAVNAGEDIAGIPAKASLGGSAITDRFKELPKPLQFVVNPIGAAISGPQQTEEQSFQNSLARQDFDAARAKDNEENPDRAAIGMARLAEANKEAVIPFTDGAKVGDMAPSLREAALKDVDQNMVQFFDFLAPGIGEEQLLRLGHKPLQHVTDVTAKTTQKALLGTKVSERMLGVAPALEKVGTGLLALNTALDRKAKALSKLISGDETALFRHLADPLKPFLWVPGKGMQATGRFFTDLGRTADKVGRAGRKGYFERAARSAESSEGTRKFLGDGSYVKARILDAASSATGYYAKRGIEGGITQMALGLGNVEDGKSAGEIFGSGMGLGAFSASMPHTFLPAMEEHRRVAENADILRAMTAAGKETENAIEAAVSPKVLSASYAGQARDLQAQINASYAEAGNEARRKELLDMKLKHEAAAAFWATVKEDSPGIVEAKRMAKLGFTDLAEVMRPILKSKGFGDTEIKVMTADQIAAYYKQIYGAKLSEAQAVLSDPNAAGTDKAEAANTIQQIETSIADAQETRGHMISEKSYPAGESPVKGAVVILNASHRDNLLSKPGNFESALRHEVAHALEEYGQAVNLRDQVAPDLFAKYFTDPVTGEKTPINDGLYTDTDADADAEVYLSRFSPEARARLEATAFNTPEKRRTYMRAERFAESIGLSAEAGQLLQRLNSPVQAILDWAAAKSLNGRLGAFRDTLVQSGKLPGLFTGSSTILNAVDAQSLAMTRNYLRAMRDYQDKMLFHVDPANDVQIPILRILKSPKLQEKFKEIDLFATDVGADVFDSTGKKVASVKILDPFFASGGEYSFKGGRFEDADGNETVLPLEVQQAVAALPGETKINIGTRIVRNPDGTPKLLSGRETKARASARGEAIQNALDTAPDVKAFPNAMKDVGNGSYRGVMTLGQLAAIKALPEILVANSLKRKIFAFNAALGRGDGTRFLINYQPVYRGGKARALSPKFRDVVPIGFQFTKDHNFLAVNASVSRMFDKLNYYSLKMPEKLALWAGDQTAFVNDLAKYLQNHAANIHGEGEASKPETLLASDIGVALEKKNILNDFLNMFDADTANANPVRTKIKAKKGQDSPDRIIMSARMDRITDIEESAAQKLPIKYDLVKRNFMPGEKSPLGPGSDVEHPVYGSGRVAGAFYRPESSEVPIFFDKPPADGDTVPNPHGGRPITMVSRRDLTTVGQLLRANTVVISPDGKKYFVLDAEEDGSTGTGVILNPDPENKNTGGLVTITSNDMQPAVLTPDEVLDFRQGMLSVYSSEGWQKRKTTYPITKKEFKHVLGQVSKNTSTKFMPASNGFYSSMETGLFSKLQGKAASKEQVLALLQPGKIKGIKPEEVKWSGILPKIDELASKNNGKVPLDELRSWMAEEARYNVEEVNYGQVPTILGVDVNQIQWEQGELPGGAVSFTAELPDGSRATIYAEEDGRSIMTILDPDGEDTGMEPEYPTVEAAMQDVPAMHAEALPRNSAPGETKFAGYQIPGGKNYRELVLTLPIKKTWQDGSPVTEEDLQDPHTAAAAERVGVLPDGIYSSTHFPGVDYVAHLRRNDRVDSSGEEGTLAEEFQSDRHQEGRKKGYKNDSQELPAGFTVAKNPDAAAPAGLEYIVKNINDGKSYAFGPTEQAARQRALEVMDRAEGTVPDAPYKKDWPLALFKRLLRDAIAEGKQWVGWTAGIDQVKRYENELRKAVDQIEWADGGKPGVKTVVANKNGKPVFVATVDSEGKILQTPHSTVLGKSLEDVVGKNIAAKILEAESGDIKDKDLSIGGEGMKGFYDDILPKEVGKYISQWNAKVEEGWLNGGAKQFVVQLAGFPDTEWDTFEEAKAAVAQLNGRPAIIDRGTSTPFWKVKITPEMKAEISEKGQPRYMPSERDPIASAAVRLGNGKIYTGTTHGDAIYAAVEAGEDASADMLGDDSNGFVTKSGKFLNRKEALKHAVAQKQMKPGEMEGHLQDMGYSPKLTNDGLMTDVFDDPQDFYDKKFMPSKKDAWTEQDHAGQLDSFKAKASKEFGHEDLDKIPARKILSWARDWRKANPRPENLFKFMPSSNGFYSRLQKGIEDDRQHTFSADQAKALGKKVTNEEELKWTGFNDAVDAIAARNHGKVPKNELLEHLKNEGNIQFEEIRLGNPDTRSQEDIENAEMEAELRGMVATDNPPAGWQEISPSIIAGETRNTNWTLPGGENHTELILKAPGYSDPDVARALSQLEVVPAPDGGFDTYFQGKKINTYPARTEEEAIRTGRSGIMNRADRLLQESPEGVAEQLATLDGEDWGLLGPNGRELYLTRAEAKLEKARRQSGAYPFSSSDTTHYSDLKALAWIRMDDRNDIDGNPGRLAQELQSKYHQQGRELGYIEDAPAYDEAKLTVKKTGTEDSYSMFSVFYDGELVAEPPYIFAKTEDEAKQIGQEAAKAGTKFGSLGKGGIPDAPFKKDWPLQLFKRMLRDAIADGKTWVGWTDGKTQADRYSLAKQVSKIVSDTKDGKSFALAVYDKSGRRVIDQSYPAEKLPEVIGKELAERIIKETPVDPNGDDLSATFEGLDLEIGGEGMKGFYDKMLVSMIGKYIKQWGGKVEPSKVRLALQEAKNVDEAVQGTADQFDPDNFEISEDGETVTDLRSEEDRNKVVPIWKVEITPEMVKSVLSQGQPKFMPSQESKKAGLGEVTKESILGSQDDRGGLRDVKMVTLPGKSVKGLSGVTMQNPAERRKKPLSGVR